MKTTRKERKEAINTPKIDLVPVLLETKMKGILSSCMEISAQEPMIFRQLMCLHFFG